MEVSIRVECEYIYMFNNNVGYCSL